MEESRRGVKQQKSERKAEVQSRREKREASAIKLGTPHQRTPRHVTKARGLAGSRSEIGRIDVGHIRPRHQSAEVMSTARSASSECPEPNTRRCEEGRSG